MSEIFTLKNYDSILHLSDLDERLYIIRLRIFQDVNGIEAVHVAYDAKCGTSENLRNAQFYKNRKNAEKVAARWNKNNHGKVEAKVITVHLFEEEDHENCN